MRFHAVTGGAENWRRAIARSLLHAPEALQAEGLSADSDAAELTLQLPGGETTKRRLPALPPLGETIAYRDWMDLVPGALPGPESENWQSYMPPGGVAEAWLADSQEIVATRALDQPNALYIRLMSGSRGGDEKTLLASALKAAEAKTFHHLILDLRLGLDASVDVDDFVRDLPKAAPDGAIFVFTGSRTLSSAIALLARIKAAAPDRVFVIGEPTGDGAQYWSETGGPFILPNSKIEVAYATAYHDVEHGCRSFPKCFWRDVLKPIAAGPIELDVPASQRFEDYKAGHDTLIEVTRILVGGPQA